MMSPKAPDVGNEAAGNDVRTVGFLSCFGLIFPWFCSHPSLLGWEYLISATVYWKHVTCIWLYQSS